MVTDISCRVGNGLRVRFWEYCWCEDRPMAMVFRKLYHLADSKGVFIGVLFCFCQGEQGVI